jgi:hypothetical protein
VKLRAFGHGRSLPKVSALGKGNKRLNTHQMRRAAYLPTPGSAPHQGNAPFADLAFN